MSLCVCVKSNLKKRFSQWTSFSLSFFSGFPCAPPSPPNAPYLLLPHHHLCCRQSSFLWRIQWALLRHQLQNFLSKSSSSSVSIQWSRTKKLMIHTRRMKIDLSSSSSSSYGEVCLFLDYSQCLLETWTCSCGIASCELRRQIIWTENFIGNFCFPLSLSLSLNSLSSLKSLNSLKSLVSLCLSAEKKFRELMSSASGTWQVFCCCCCCRLNEGCNSGELLLPICWKEVVNKHTKGEEKRSFQAFLREEKREPRSEEQGTSKKRKKEKKSLSCLYQTMTQDCKHTTKKKTKKEDEEEQQEREEEEEEDDPGSTARDRPAGARHSPARHGWAASQRAARGRQRDPWILFFCPTARSPLQERLANCCYELGNFQFPSSHTLLTVFSLINTLPTTHCIYGTHLFAFPIKNSI